MNFDALGAACAGKTHLVEFAAGLYGDNAHYGDCPHPHFADRLSDLARFRFDAHAVGAAFRLTDFEMAPSWLKVPGIAIAGMKA